MPQQMLAARNLMPVWPDPTTPWQTRRQQIAEQLCREEYGFLPREHDRLTWAEGPEVLLCDGRVAKRRVTLCAHFGQEIFSFPVDLYLPQKSGRLPFFVHISFGSRPRPVEHLPLEELYHSGMALLSFSYGDVTPDKATEEVACDPLVELLYRNIEKQPHHAGKIRIWAWAASRVLDYALTLDALDGACAAVVGHSRLGKTALLAGMLDERFALVISNQSGCSGAAVTRGKAGERIADITQRFPYWFCDHYAQYAHREEELPFDQHFLLAACAPRHVYVASAAEDEWADPASEFLSCVAADEVYRKLGLTGFVHAGEMPKAPASFHGGQVGYHVRPGQHFLHRDDWAQYLSYARCCFAK